MRYFDTAPLYGHGLSEARMGAVLRGCRRGDYVLSTKVGRLLDPCPPGEQDGGLFVDIPPMSIRYDYSYDGVMRSHEESLKRIGVDRVDILFVHDIDSRNHGSVEACETRIRELIDQGGWRALDELRAAGDVSAIGAGVNEWEPCAKLLKVSDPDLFLLAGALHVAGAGAAHRALPRVRETRRRHRQRRAAELRRAGRAGPVRLRQGAAACR